VLRNLCHARLTFFRPCSLFFSPQRARARFIKTFPFHFLRGSRRAMRVANEEGEDGDFDSLGNPSVGSLVVPRVAETSRRVDGSTSREGTRGVHREGCTRDANRVIENKRRCIDGGSTGVRARATRTDEATRLTPRSNASEMRRYWYAGIPLEGRHRLMSRYRSLSVGRKIR